PSTRGLVSVLFLSDGAQTRGDLLPLQGADRAKAAGIPIYTVALGTPGGTLSRDPNFGNGGGGFPSGGGGGGFGFGSIPVPPDPGTLRAIADRTALSSVWSPGIGPPLDDAELVLVYAVGLASFLVFT